MTSARGGWVVAKLGGMRWLGKGGKWRDSPDDALVFNRHRRAVEVSRAVPDQVRVESYSEAQLRLNQYLRDSVEELF